MGQQTHGGTNRKERSDSQSCPICGKEPDDVVELHPENANREVPGIAYDHDGEPLCIEWADGVIQRE